MSEMKLKAAVNLINYHILLVSGVCCERGVECHIIAITTCGVIINTCTHRAITMNKQNDDANLPINKNE